MKYEKCNSYDLEGRIHIFENIQAFRHSILLRICVRLKIDEDLLYF